MLRKQYRQGDILISEFIPFYFSAENDDKFRLIGAVPKNGRVLSEGEKTGHKHEVAEGYDVQLYERQDGTLYMRVNSPEAIIKHPEHGSINVVKGDYQIIQQKEYDPAEGFRPVTD